MPTDYKSTLQLPETNFPMRANLPTREAERMAYWEKQELYYRIIEARKGKEKFILHDGPPFTNGNAHMGHLLNKTYKDIIVRYKALRGYYTPYIPGWDCHGLPTEQKMLAELKESGKDMSVADLRRKCHDFSEKNIAIMTGQFSRLGVLSDWKKAYRTMDPSYEAETLRAVAGFVEKGLVYRGLRPVIWSIPCRSALAEAEIEYHDHVSPSIWVAMPTVEDPNTAFVVWTTTPWTIPSNIAIAVNPRLGYVEVKIGDKKYIVAEALAEKFTTAVGFKEFAKSAPVKGSTYEGKQYTHPFMKHVGRVILADFVSAEDGTGCVHIAPGHGMEDYLAGIANNLEVYSPLDNDGKYMNDGRIPSELIGLTTLEKNGKSEANEAVIALLKRIGALLGQAPYPHQYPFCWRSKTPIVFRALEQWFVGLDRDNTRQKVVAAVDTASWIPTQSRNRIIGTIESRPDWCISRQRSWGLPIPAFYDADGKRYIDASVIRSLADKVAQHGSNIFFEWSAQKLLEGVKLPADWDANLLKPESDTLDVWMESGSSSLAVVRKMPELQYPADLYLEASDQHRGWFQYALWMNVVNTGKAPFNNVFTHEWVLDDKKEKLSKSKNSLSATEMIKKYGADVLRLWVASQDYTNSIPLSEEILSQISTAYSSSRNTLRYQLANLKGFNAATDSVDLEQMLPIDRWMVWKLSGLIDIVTAAYERYDFSAVYQEVSRFSQVNLSSIYHDIIKDRMYTCDASSLERRSAQTALGLVFDALVKMLSPIMPYTMDEAWSYRLTDGDFSADSVHLQNWPITNPSWKNQQVASDVEALLKMRSLVNEKLELLRKEKVIGKSLEARVTFQASSESYRLLKTYEKDLPELFIVSQIVVDKHDSDIVVVSEKIVDAYKCPRCWRYVSSSPETLCARCENTLASKSNA